MAKSMTDYDLDVYNALKDFPNDNDHVYLYVRSAGSPVQAQGDDNADAVAGFCGNVELLSAALSHIMKDKEEIVPALLDAVAEYLAEKENTDYRNAFLMGLEENIKIKS